MKFDKLVNEICKIDEATKNIATKAVNKALTFRNWIIGAYIQEFEQNGLDRAEYGESLFDAMSKRLNTKGYSARNLRLFRQFYQVYPFIKESKYIVDFFGDISHEIIWQSSTAKLEGVDNQGVEMSQSVTAISEEKEMLHVDPDRLLSHLSFTHLVELCKMKDPYKRMFYELEIMKGVWSVSQLKRQINALYYERSSLSKDPEALMNLTQSESNEVISTDLLKDVFVMEFLDLPVAAVVKESDLEKALLDNIEHFLLELGHGFCFEARQQKILIGDEYYFIDLVFYHRILKCHVLVELKVESFSHHNAGQLNTYINYYKDQIKKEDDNPPIGILLVTDKNSALVEYATAGLDEQLFVRKYLVELPEVSVMKDMIEKEIK